jgi:uncharacterized protein involved in outer membrane biogenesis
MKKILRILLITVGVILLLLILIPILFRSRIEAAVKKQINANATATVDWTRFSVSLFRGFPDLSVNLHQVSVVGMGEFEGDTLAGLKRFELRVNPFSAIRKEIQVKSVLLDQPVVNGIVLEDGTANWEITKKTVTDQVEELPEGVEAEKSVREEEAVPEKEAGAEEEPGGALGVSLKRFAIRDGRIYYNDAVMDAEASLEGFNLELKGDFSMEETELELDVDVHRLNAKYGGIRYMRDGSFGLELTAAANLVENTYSMLDNKIRLNGLVLGIEGEVDMMDDGGMGMDLRFFTRETSFQTLLSMVPAIYLTDFKSVRASGTLGLEGTINGVMKDSLLPDASITLEVKDGFFAYPDLPKDVSDVQIRLVATYDGTEMDRSVVDLERFHLLLGGNPFDVRLHVDHPVSDMHVAGAVKGLIDLASLGDVIPMEDINITGRLTADMDLDTRMSCIEQERYEEVGLEGRLVIEGVRVDAQDIPVPLDLQKMEMNFNPRFVDLAGLDLKLGASDLHMKGELSNFIPYIFTDATVSGVLDVSSALLDIDELVPAGEAEDTGRGGAAGKDTAVTEEIVLAEVPPDSLAEPVRLKIPENIDFTLGLDLKKVVYDKILVDNIRGGMVVRGGVANLDGLRMDVIGGSVTAGGKVDTRGDYAEADMTLDMLGVDIPSSYATFVTVERLAPMAKYCRGDANVKLEYNSLLDASFSPLYGTIQANGRVFTRNLQIYNLKSFVRLSELLKNEKFRDMAPDDMDIKFRVRDGRVIVDPFDLDFDDSRITVSGSHGIDLTMDYLLDMNIAKSDLGEGANAVMSGVAALASGAGFDLPQSDYVKVKARITGTFSDPKITTDLSGNLQSAKESVKAAIEERVTEEVKKVEEEVREEVSEKAEEIMKQAGEEAGRIMDEARKQGEDLVKEAEKQGAKLVKEAGSNPIKKLAAQKASDEMVYQAKKQSENLIREAQAKADETLAKARAEAARINQ